MCFPIFARFPGAFVDIFPINSKDEKYSSPVPILRIQDTVLAGPVGTLLLLLLLAVFAVCSLQSVTSLHQNSPSLDTEHCVTFVGLADCRDPN